MLRSIAATMGLLAVLWTPLAHSAPCGGFTDVDDANPAHAPFCESVEWIKNRGITLGCASPPNPPTSYCPNENVTRLQMAAFMYRLGFQNAFLRDGNAFGTTAVLGTTDNQPLDVRVNNSRVMRYEPHPVSPNLIGGSPANNVTAGVRGATIGGGGVPVGDTDPNFGNEAPNRVTDAYGTVAGGYNNVAGDDAGSTIDSIVATVGGGRSNRASSTFSTVAGGNANTASGQSSAVAGGNGNIASGIQSVSGGGGGNAASGASSIVAGGASNTASGDGSNVAGGTFNLANETLSTIGGGSSNTASGSESVVGGGSVNTSSGGNSTVAGGGLNIASGFASMVAGGSGNVAAGHYSFAAGHNARSMNSGCFTWADSSSDTPFVCGGFDAFVARAAGGVYFRTNAAATTGVDLFGGAGSWSMASDRALKEHIVPVDPRDVLERLLRMPVATWNYRAQDASIRHMGPMAQDVHAAFSLGESDKRISSVDANGIAFAAIQGLNAKLEATVAEQARENARLRAELVELRSLKEEVASIRAAQSRDSVAGR